MTAIDFVIQVFVTSNSQAENEDGSRKYPDFWKTHTSFEPYTPDEREAAYKRIRARRKEFPTLHYRLMKRQAGIVLMEVEVPEEVTPEPEETEDAVTPGD